MIIRYELLYEQVKLVIASKLEEFQYYGYKGMTAQLLWDYCLDKKWHKKEVDELHLHEKVATIYRLTASEIMSYEQIKDFRYLETVALTKEEIYFLLYASIDTEGVE